MLYSDPSNVLDANTAFVALTLFNLLRVPLNMLPMLLVFMVQCEISLRRMNTFMNAEELDPAAVAHDESSEYPVELDNASFSWAREAEPVLKVRPVSTTPVSFPYKSSYRAG